MVIEDLPCRFEATDLPRGVHRRTASNPNIAGNNGHFGGNEDAASRLMHSSLPSSLPPEIRPPAKRSEMFFTTPVAAQL